MVNVLPLRFLITMICVMVLSVPLCPANALGVEKKDAPEKISINVNNKPLGDVLKLIAQKAGYRITINSEYAKLPVTSSFEDLTVYQALRRVLGQLNRYVIINETERVITFGFVGDPAAAGMQTAAVKSKKYHIMDLEVVPPDEPGGTSITHREAEELRKNRPKYNPEDVELVPPDVPGQKTITAKEVKERKYNLDELEIIPPDNPGEKGMTLKEIEALKRKK